MSAQQHGVLPISQQSTFVLASLAYHGYEGVAIRDDEKARLQADLGQANYLMLRNHGLLTVGKTIADAFLSMYTFEATCQIQLPDLLFEYPEGAPVDEVLLTIARNFQALISSDEAVKLSRLIMAQGSLDPSFGEYFYEAGPKRVLAGMEALLRGANERGLLRIDNPLRAAEHFFCLVKGAPDYRLLLGCAGPLEGNEAEAHVREVVGVFLRAFKP